MVPPPTIRKELKLKKESRVPPLIIATIINNSPAKKPAKVPISYFLSIMNYF